MASKMMGCGQKPETQNREQKRWSFWLEYLDCEVAARYFHGQTGSFGE